MVMALAPGSFRGFFFVLGRGLDCHSEPIAIRRGHGIVRNNDFKPVAFHQFSAAEFARLSASMKVMFLIIRRAQLSSRKAVAVTAEWKRRSGGG
jgi:hypothetical protein